MNELDLGRLVQSFCKKNGIPVDEKNMNLLKLLTDVGGVASDLFAKNAKVEQSVKMVTGKDSMMICPNCGTHVIVEYRECIACGVELYEGASKDLVPPKPVEAPAKKTTKKADPEVEMPSQAKIKKMGKEDLQHWLEFFEIEDVDIEGKLSDVRKAVIEAVKEWKEAVKTSKVKASETEIEDDSELLEEMETEVEEPEEDLGEFEEEEGEEEVLEEFEEEPVAEDGEEELEEFEEESDGEALEGEEELEEFEEEPAQDGDEDLEEFEEEATEDGEEELEEFEEEELSEEPEGEVEFEEEVEGEEDDLGEFEEEVTEEGDEDLEEFEEEVSDGEELEGDDLEEFEEEELEEEPAPAKKTTKKVAKKAAKKAAKKTTKKVTKKAPAKKVAKKASTSKADKSAEREKKRALLKKKIPALAKAPSKLADLAHAERVSLLTILGELVGNKKTLAELGGKDNVIAHLKKQLTAWKKKNAKK